MDFQKFLQGGVFDAYEYFGAHAGEDGVTFRIYAPKAEKVEPLAAPWFVPQVMTAAG